MMLGYPWIAGHGVALGSLGMLLAAAAAASEGRPWMTMAIPTYSVLRTVVPYTGRGRCRLCLCSLLPRSVHARASRLRHGRGRLSPLFALFFAFFFCPQRAPAGRGRPRLPCSAAAKTLTGEGYRHRVTHLLASLRPPVTACATDRTLASGDSEGTASAKRQRTTALFPLTARRRDSLYRPPPVVLRASPAA